MPPINPPTGQVDRDTPFTTLDFSSWLGLVVESRLRDIPGWTESHPIALGSWGRGELCPHSDLDLLFCGPEERVLEVVAAAEEMGLSLRYRVPADPVDWSQGVGVFDTNALFWAKPFTREGAVRLQEQKAKILGERKAFRKLFLRQIIEERKKRQARYDSIANFLEPNLKFGAGGLRDLLQAVFLQFWFSEKFVDSQHAFRVLSYYRKFFLIVRQRLHMQTGMDILVAAEQPELSRWFGFSKNLQFMGEVQKGLARVSFHSDWVLGRSSASKGKILKLESERPRSWKDAFAYLEKDPGVLSQYEVRRGLYETKGFQGRKEGDLTKGRLLRKALRVENSPQFLTALFWSQIVSHSVPEFSKIIGLVQHDQYHRYSVDAHLLQAMREVKKCYQKPKRLGKLAHFVKGMTPMDWEILTWAALYHDIAKGSGEHHAQAGKRLAARDLKNFGMPTQIVAEVAWIVEKHLILSTAAFRKNARSKKTWSYLYAQGVSGRRIERLTVFTAIDILATNPDAWTSWKEHLLYELAQTLKEPSAEKYFELTTGVLQKKIDIHKDFVDALELVVVENVPHSLLLSDFKQLSQGNTLKPIVYEDPNGYMWVRYHSYEDQSGLFLGYVRSIASMGCSVRYAGVLTDPRYGVYDWFQIKTKAKKQGLLKLMAQELPLPKLASCFFSHIQLVSGDHEEWVFSFRARDRKGLLISASEALSRHSLEILWARVFTWGRQIDDVFGVKPIPGKDPQKILDDMRESLVGESGESYSP